MYKNYEDVLKKHGWLLYGESGGDEAYSKPDREELVELFSWGGWNYRGCPTVYTDGTSIAGGSTPEQLDKYLSKESK